MGLLRGLGLSSVLVCALALLVAGSSAGSARPSRFGRLDEPKLDSQLGRIAETAAQQGTGAAMAQAAGAGLGTQTNKVRVVVVARPGAARGALAALSGAGGAKIATAGALTSALVPPSALRALAASPAVAEVRPSFLHKEGSADEAIPPTDAGVWHTAGFTGSGVNIGIIDLGFAGYTTALGGATVTLDNQCADINTTPHGTGVAEIVHQMAPAAHLFLYCIDDEVELSLAEQQAIADGVRIINHSVSWFDTSRGDGTGGAGTPDAIVADAQAHGILWVNAAGNEALDHWAGSFTPDPSAPDLNDFSPDVDHNDLVMGGNESACLGLKWDAWPVTSEDYDLYLVQASDGTVVASSVNDQADGPIAPVEELCYTNPNASATTYSVYIQRYSAAGNEQLDLFYLGAGTLSLPVTESVTEPASSPAALAVGAECWQTGRLEGYSSLGPTIDGRTKPDLVAPDSVSTTTYGPATSGAGGCGTSGFTGTSAAAPQVAGAAALLLQRQPALTPGELTTALEERAQANKSNTQGTSPPDDQYGHGPLALGPFTASIGTIAYQFSGATYVTDGEMNQLFINGAGPAWSPDGSQIAVYENGLWIYDQLGNVVRSPIANTASGDIQPAWSPDGSTLVFYRSSANAIDKVNVGTTVVTQLATGVTNPDPVWAPDNSKIAFVKSGDIWLMDPNGANQTQLTHLGNVTSPDANGDVLAWSPDSSKLAFVVGSNPFAIWVVNANGTNPHSLATGWAPSWSPDGSQILFTVTGAALDLMNADGSNVRPLNPHESMISASIQTTTWTSAAITTPNPDPSALRPDLEGEPLVGSWLQLENTGWVGAVDNNLEATWYRCQPSNLCATTLPSTTTSYRLTANDLGFYIGARVDPAVHGPSYRAILSDPTIPILPAVPTASDLPTISGTAVSGSTLMLVSPATWTGSPSFDYQWERCGAGGGSCEAIDAATSTSYGLTAADVGHTIRAVVYGSNTGGFSDAISQQSSVVTGIAGGGGGGGGGGGPLDLATSVTASATQVSPGGSITYRVAVNDLTPTPANHLHVIVTLPAGAVVASATADRGSGCAIDPTPGELNCNLDYLAGSGSAGNIVIVASLTQAGQATLTAVAKSDQMETNLANNTASITVQVGTTISPPPPPPPPPALPAPHLAKTTTRVLSTVDRGRNASLDEHFTANEALHLTMTVTKLSATRPLTLLTTSRLASSTLRAPAARAHATVAHRGAYSFHVVLKRATLVKGATYVVHVAATNAHGKSTALAIRFRG